MRLVAGVGRAKVGVMKQLPYAWARLGVHPEAKEEIIQLWNTTPEANRDPASQAIMTDPVMRAQFDEYEHGSDMGEDLSSEVSSIADLNFDDSVGEGPHARATRVGMGSRRAQWPWIASTLRLDQNIALVERYSELGVDMQSLWDS